MPPRPHIPSWICSSITYRYRQGARIFGRRSLELLEGWESCLTWTSWRRTVSLSMLQACVTCSSTGAMEYFRDGRPPSPLGYPPNDSVPARPFFNHWYPFLHAPLGTPGTSTVIPLPLLQTLRAISTPKAKASRPNGSSNSLYLPTMRPFFLADSILFRPRTVCYLSFRKFPSSFGSASVIGTAQLQG